MKTVPLHAAKAAGRVALVDDEDYELVAPHRWRVAEQERKGSRPSGPYAVTVIRQGGRQVQVSMHKMITGWPLTDHVNHNGLDNRRSNLRPATMVQNGQNSLPNVRRGSSRHKGVHWHSRSRLWIARIRHQGKQRHLGCFASENEAAAAYDAAAQELFGEYALLNFPASPTVIP